MLRRIWPAVPTVARLIALTLVLTQWVGTSAPDIPRDIGSPGLERLDPRPAAISHRAPAVLAVKPSPIERVRDAFGPAGGDALPAATPEIPDRGVHPEAFGKSEDRIAAVAHRYDARGPPSV